MPKGTMVGPNECPRAALTAGGLAPRLEVGMPRKYIRGSVDVRFWGHVQKQEGDGCWLWDGATYHDGYGAFGLTPHMMRRAHRMAWELTHGPIPAGLVVCHRCDVRLCCRPDHLFLGTVKENQQDMATKGRSTKGEKNRAAKLTDAQVRALRLEYAQGGITMYRLAKNHGLNNQHVWKIVRRLLWRNLP